MREKLKDSEFVEKFLKFLVDDRETLDEHATVAVQNRNGSYEERLVNSSYAIVDRWADLDKVLLRPLPLDTTDGLKMRIWVK